MLELNFSNETDATVEEGIFEDKVKKLSEAMGDRVSGYLKGRKGLISLAIVDDEKIQNLNRAYREKDEATDVLSFAYLEDGDLEVGDRVTVGDIFISVERAKRQAEEKGHGLDKELVILFVHGLLHLFGYEHGNDQEESEMEKWAEKILE